MNEPTNINPNLKSPILVYTEDIDFWAIFEANAKRMFTRSWAPLPTYVVSDDSPLRKHLTAAGIKDDQLINPKIYMDDNE